MIESDERVNAILWLIVAFISLAPLIIFLVSYIRVRSKKILITTAAFCLFFTKALVLSMKLFIPAYDDEVWWTVAAILDILIIGSIAYAIGKKA